MNRLKATNSVNFAGRDTAPGTGTPQYATSGVPGVTPATDFPAYAWNMVQDELMAVITAAGLTPDDTNWAQLLAALQTMFGNAPVIWGGTSTGSANAQSLTTTPTLTAVAVPCFIVWIAGFSNTGALTLALDAIAGTKAVTKRISGGTAALVGGEVKAGELYMTAYDGTEHVLTTPAHSQVFWAREEQANGTNSADAMVASTWVQRTLTTVKLNEITGASLGSNQITLPAGTYELEALVPISPGGSINTFSRARLFNVTAGSTVIEGQSMAGLMGNSTTITLNCPLRAKFSLAVSSVLRIDQISNQNLGNAIACSLGGVEAYTTVFIRKVD